MKSYKLEPAFFLLLSLALGACASTGAELALPEGIGQPVPVAGGGSYVDILPQELDRILQERDIFLVNVHVPYEGEIVGTDAHLPFDQINSLLAQFPAHRDANIVVYCRSGSMSAIAARDLVASGYTSIYNLDGGFRAWVQAGYEFQD